MAVLFDIALYYVVCDAELSHIALKSFTSCTKKAKNYLNCTKMAQNRVKLPLKSSIIVSNCSKRLTLL